MKIKHKPRTSKDFPAELEHVVPDSWVEDFVTRRVASIDTLMPHKAMLVNLCKEFLDGVREYRKSDHAFDNLRFTADKDGNVDKVWVKKVDDYVYLHLVNPYFLLNLQKALADRDGLDGKAYKAVMAEIQRRVDSGQMYPPKPVETAA